MSSIEYLLSLDPLQALVRMVNDANGTTFRLDRFRAGVPTVVAGTTTKVTLTGMVEALAVDDQTTIGSFDLTYERLDMATFLKDTLKDYHPYLPLSVQNILDQITSLIGQTFYIDDIVLEEVTRDTAALYRLKAKPESLRFVGWIDLPLITLSPITPYLPSDALVGVTDTSPEVFQASDSLPFLNATDYRTMAESFVPGELGQDRIDLVTLFNAVVPDPDKVRATPSPWYVNATPGPFNLLNARVIGYGTGYNVNTAIPTLERALFVALDGTYTTNFASGTLAIPYTTVDFNTLGYTDQPRSTANSIVSLSDGSAWNVYLNSFAVGQVIDTFQQIPPVYLEGANAWVAQAGLILPANLAGARVLYNGQLRDSDIPPAVQGLDRVLVVQMSEFNAIWQGEYSFFYASPIKVRLRDLVSTVGSSYFFDFTPYRGTGPFTYAITRGVVPENLVLNADGTLTGIATTAQAVTYDLTVTDTNGVSVVFTVTHRVTEAVTPLVLSGTLPPATALEPYLAFLDIRGGLAPYVNPIMVSGNAPNTILLEVINNAIRVYGSWPAGDTYHLAVGISSTDGQSTSKSFTVVVAAGEGGGDDGDGSMYVTETIAAPSWLHDVVALEGNDGSFVGPTQVVATHDPTPGSPRAAIYLAMLDQYTSSIEDTITWPEPALDGSLTGRVNTGYNSAIEVVFGVPTGDAGYGFTDHYAPTLQMTNIDDPSKSVTMTLTEGTGDWEGEMVLTNADGVTAGVYGSAQTFNDGTQAGVAMTVFWDTVPAGWRTELPVMGLTGDYSIVAQLNPLNGELAVATDPRVVHLNYVDDNPQYDWVESSTGNEVDGTWRVPLDDSGPSGDGVVYAHPFATVYDEAIRLAIEPGVPNVLLPASDGVNPIPVALAGLTDAWYVMVEAKMMYNNDLPNLPNYSIPTVYDVVMTVTNLDTSASRSFTLRDGFMGGGRWVSGTDTPADMVFWEGGWNGCLVNAKTYLSGIASAFNGQGVPTGRFGLKVTATKIADPSVTLEIGTEIIVTP